MLTIYQAGIGLLQLQDNVNHHLQEGCVPAVALERFKKRTIQFD